MNKKTIVLIMGRSGCGKSTLEKRLILDFPHQFKKVISSTTRKPRPKERDGKDYYFITEEKYDQLDFVQRTSFAGNRYGSAISEYCTTHPFPVLVVTPQSAAGFVKTIEERFPYWKTFVIYFDISDERLMKNLRKRGDSEEAIVERLKQDDLIEQFKNSGLVADLVVHDGDLDNVDYQSVVLHELIRYHLPKKL